MTIGTGIFLSTLCLIAVYLCKSIKFNWKRLLKVTLLLIFVGVSFGFLCFIGISLYDQKYKFFPVKQNDYANISLGMTMSEVKYLKGNPLFVIDNNSSNSKIHFIRYLNEFEPKQKIEDFLGWGYEEKDSNHRLQMYFDGEGKIKSVFCHSIGFMACPRLLGIWDGISERELVEKIGKPTIEKISDSAVKIMQYEDLNITFFLEKGQVYLMQMGIYQGSFQDVPIKKQDDFSDIEAILQSKSGNVYDPYKDPELIKLLNSK